MKSWDPSSVSNEQLDAAVARGDFSDYNRTDNGGIQKYYDLPNGDTKVKDTEPADNDKRHNTTEFTISNGYITNIEAHSTNG